MIVDDDHPAEGHIRCVLRFMPIDIGSVGWATKEANVQFPVGFDEHGFAYRDLGSAVHRSIRDDDYGETFGAGDVIGSMISLTVLAPPEPVQSTEAPPDPVEGTIRFFKNGKDLGVAHSFMADKGELWSVLK